LNQRTDLRQAPAETHRLPQTTARPPAGLVALAGGVALAALLPVAYLVIRAGGGGWSLVADTLFLERTGRLLLRSLGLAAAVSAASAAIGIALAWLTVRCDIPGRRVWRVLVALPLAVPSYVAAFAFVSNAPELTGFLPTFLVLTLLSYPYVFLPVAAVLEHVDPALEDTARSLGDGPFAAFRRVTLRQIRPAAATGSLLVCLYVLSDFGAVSILRFDSFTRVIYQSYQSSFDRRPAAILGCLLLVFTMGILVAEARTRGRARYYGGSRGARRRASVVRLGRWRWPALAVPVAVLGLGLAVPLGTALRWLAESVQASVDLERIGRAGVSTVVASGLGAAVTALAAVPVGLLAARSRSRVAGMIERSAFVAHALPGIVVALSLVFFTVRFANPLYQRLPVLIFAYMVLFLSLAVSSVYSSALQAPPALDEVARSLGKRPIQVFRTITAPLIAPGVGAGAALVFLTCLKELPATLLLGPTGFETLATRVWSATQAGAYGDAALPALLLVAAGVLPTWALTRRGRTAG
jgi:iron(III) transport system permease protein